MQKVSAAPEKSFEGTWLIEAPEIGLSSQKWLGQAGKPW